MNVVKDTKIVPFQGPAATDYAQKLMARQRTQEAIGREFNQTISKASSTVKFNKAYAARRRSPALAGAAAAPAKAATQ